MSLRMIGVGLHRTGLLSVKVALERLGFAARRPEPGRTPSGCRGAEGVLQVRSDF
jgi:hypothetical protein